MRDIYSEVTEKIIEKLEAGVIPWKKPWVVKNGNIDVPRNFVTNKPYRGINYFLLAMSEYTSPYWLTFKQAKKCGGFIRKGEKATAIIFWNYIYYNETNEEGEVEQKSRAFLKSYNVFNVEQCEKLDVSKYEVSEEDVEEFEHDPIATAEQIIENMPCRPVITHVGARAYYSPLTDVVNIPELKNFPQVENYYGTTFHELTHSTGADTRVNRGLSDNPACFGSHEYSKEELVAEMGAAMLCAVSGISDVTLDNSAAYIDSWLSVLKKKNNRKLVVTAAAQAQKAVDFILGQSGSGSGEGGE